MRQLSLCGFAAPKSMLQIFLHTGHMLVANYRNCAEVRLREAVEKQETKRMGEKVFCLLPCSQS